DLSFGYKGMGNKELLLKLSESCGYEVQIIQKVFYENREISSTFVREEVEKGHMAVVRSLLGRYYSFEGKVKEGNRLGRKLGMPTLNLYPLSEKLLPPKGVYYSRVFYENCTYPGITNIGNKPTVNQDDMISVETYLYDFDRDMYGKEIVTELLQFKRPEQKFGDVAQLKRQMEKDIAQGREFHRGLK
ncbi:MAG: bifunctional riboflavin kinase/FMN adenylyltransferase, partial [Lachnospiraceae bacterium]|nr:bifunctional riboflavin kinase/FMN adenylyltransferase [Lachnospiraceae bacterium]